MAHLNSASTSTQCRSQYDSHTHPRLVSSPCRPLDSNVTSVWVGLQLNPGSFICVSSQSRLCLTPMQVQETHLSSIQIHISRPSTFENACLSSIQVVPHLTFPSLLPRLPPCNISNQSMSKNSSIHVASHQVMMLAFHIHPFHVSLPSRSRELLISSILVPPQHIQVSRCVSQPNPGPITHPSLYICVPSPSRLLD